VGHRRFEADCLIKVSDGARMVARHRVEVAAIQVVEPDRLVVVALALFFILAGALLVPLSAGLILH